MLDAKWLDALKLPTKAKAAVLLASLALLAMFRWGLLTLGSLDALVITGLTISAVVFAILVLLDGLAWLARPLAEERKRSLIAKRRAVRLGLKEEEQAAHRAVALGRLDHLSREEVMYVAKALEAGSPTFYTYVHAPPTSVLLAKGLVWTPGGTHHQDRYPFSFHDFVWAELLRRRDEFLTKERTFVEAEKAAEEVARRARRRI